MQHSFFASSHNVISPGTYNAGIAALYVRINHTADLLFLFLNLPGIRYHWRQCTDAEKKRKKKEKKVVVERFSLL